MIITSDLKFIYKSCEVDFKNFHNKTIFITGGTGFFGKCLLEALIYAQQCGNLNLSLIVLTRNSKKFLSDFEYFNSSFIKFLNGDITNFDFPKEKIDYIFHMATEASVSLNLNSPFQMFNVITEGSKRILELGKIKNVKSILFTSSGAVYGNQPSDLIKINENFQGSPNIFNKDAAYGEGKRVSEMYANLYYENYGVNTKIARCFAFVGPHLPLNSHFAIGNFINNLLNNEDIEITGDGSPFRSYMYSSDLIIWLIKILLHAQPCDPINVGSDYFISISELAKTIVNLFPNSIKNINIAEIKTNETIQRYVPSIEKAKNKLNLDVTVSLEDAIKKTVLYHQKKLSQ